MNDNRRELLSTFPIVEEADYLWHMSAFVASFVESRKRERWLYLLANRPKRIGRDSHKLHSDLDRRKCRRFENHHEMRGIAKVGVYYEFRDEPRWLDVGTALDFNRVDSILSVVAGQWAIFFFHELETWLCESK